MVFFLMRMLCFWKLDCIVVVRVWFDKFGNWVIRNFFKILGNVDFCFWIVFFIVDIGLFFVYLYCEWLLDCGYVVDEVGGCEFNFVFFSFFD